MLAYTVSALGTASPSALGEAGTVMTYTGAALAFIVGGVSTLAKLKYANFDAMAATHCASVTAWNGFWSTIEQQTDMPVGRRVDACDFLQRLGTQFAALETASEEQLPLWARRACTAAWKRTDPTAPLPDMCRDAAVS